MQTTNNRHHNYNLNIIKGHPAWHMTPFITYYLMFDLILGGKPFIQ